MGLSKELEALKRRANRAALATRMPDIEMLVYHEGDEIPQASSDWAIRVMIEKKHDWPIHAPAITQSFFADSDTSK